VSYRLYYTKRAQKDAKKIRQAGLQPNVENLLALLQTDPWQTPPRYEKLVGDLADAYSRRINFKHRLAYQIFGEEKAVKILAMWTHYD